MPTLRERIAAGAGRARRAGRVVGRFLMWCYREGLIEHVWLPLRWLGSSAIDAGIRAWEPRSFGVYSAAGKLFFVEANGFTVDRDGRLLFRRFGRLVCAVDAGKWERVLEGIRLKDFKE